MCDADKMMIAAKQLEIVVYGLTTALAMQAANTDRMIQNQSMAYSESDFVSIAENMRQQFINAG